MNEPEGLEAFRSEIHNDKGLKAKRQLVTYISLIILAINLSGATIKEANTFLFKIEFLTPVGLKVLLAVALVFCLIRYLNYSYKYALQLSQFWKERFLSDKRILDFDHYGETYFGLLSPIANKNFSSRFGMLRNGEVEKFERMYVSSFIPFKKRYIESWINNSHGGEKELEEFNVRKEIGFLNLLKVMKIEWTYRIEAYFRYPETLDLKAPLIIAGLAYSSIFFKDKISYLVSLFS